MIAVIFIFAAPGYIGVNGSKPVLHLYFRFVIITNANNEQQTRIKVLFLTLLFPGSIVSPFKSQAFISIKKTKNKTP